MEDYKKKYEDALERAKSAVKECGNNLGRIKMIESIFPDELMGNEDERTRKEIISALKYANHKGIYDKHIAWLEKLKDFDKQLEDAYKTADEVQYKRGYDKGYMDGYWYWRGAIEALGKQATIKDGNSIDPHFGKPITTTETKYPKFKVGDWISGYYTNYKVLSINNEGYAVEDVDGNKINILFENEKFHHLWSIKDAKDGDVLVCCNNKPFIFKGFFGLNFPNCLAAYCGVTLENQFGHCNGKTFWTNQDVKPATKEQCNLLFQKMHEAGYEWDAEKKVLNKIKMQDLVISENNVTKISDQDDKWKWDEDDEKFFRENILIGLGNIDDVNPELYSKIIDWISLIKRRLS